LLLVDGEMSTPKAENIKGLARHPYVHQNDFLDRLGMDIRRLDAIFHLGACSSTTETDWDFLRRNNVEYSQRLWSWSATNRCPFLYASSAATYGDGSLGFDDRTQPYSLRPLNLYGKSKNDFDIWALQQAAAGLATPPAWAGVKFFNVYGARERHKDRMASVVWQAFGQIQQTGAVRLFRSTHPDFPDGGQKRDFVYVEDCIDHLLWLWRNPHQGGLFNSGTGAPRSFLDLAQAVFAALGQKPVIHFIDMPSDLAGKYQSYTCAEMSKLRGAGFDEPPTSLENGAAACVAAWRE
jgi:ADP-L-glycero-D-manno-heptose 6-epimerase